MNTNLTNDQLDKRADAIFNEVLESHNFDEGLNSDDVTVLSAKLAAKFATYASDAINW
jgi:hypothetical protein